MKLIKPSDLRLLLLKQGLPADGNLHATPCFSWQELLKNQREIPSLGVLQNLLKVAQLLEFYKFKLFKGSPVTITSGWRSENYNAKIGGAAKSTHTLGMAADFTVKGFTTPQLFALMDMYHFGGVERTGGDWQHIDLRQQNVRFTPNGTILACHYDVIAHEKIFKNVM